MLGRREPERGFGSDRSPSLGHALLARVLTPGLDRPGARGRLKTAHAVGERGHVPAGGGIGAGQLAGQAVEEDAELGPVPIVETAQDVPLDRVQAALEVGEPVRLAAGRDPTAPAAGKSVRISSRVDLRSKKCAHLATTRTFVELLRRPR